MSIPAPPDSDLIAKLVEEIFSDALEDGPASIGYHREQADLRRFGVKETLPSASLMFDHTQEDMDVLARALGQLKKA